MCRFRYITAHELLGLLAGWCMAKPDKSPRAVLDVGSNTIRLLVALPRSGAIRPLVDKGKFVRLGLGVDKTGLLQPDRRRDAVRAIGSLAGTAGEAGADRMLAVATSAVRDARNGEAFVERVRRQTGVRLTVLSGEEEGRLTYLGATLETPLTGPALIVDLGGRSTEIVAAEPEGMRWARSLHAGSGRLTEQWISHDPPARSELSAVEAFVTCLVEGLPDWQPETLILTGGTARHAARLLGHGNASTVEIRPTALDRVSRLVRDVPAARLVGRFGLKPERAEIFPAGVRALQTIAQYYRPDRLIITRHGIREGVILDSMRCADRWDAA